MSARKVTLRVFNSIVWLIAIIVTVSGCTDGSQMYQQATSAIQQTDALAYIMTFAITAYIIARAITSILTYME